MLWRLLAFTASLSAAPLIPLPLPIEITIPSVPPGATTQIRLTLKSPHQITSGSLSIDLDPSVFGSPSAVDVFSANGDQVGSARFTENHVEVSFTSNSGGIGRLPGLPALVVTVPVLAATPAAATGSVRIAPGADPWKDALGYQYLPAAMTGSFKATGALSIDSVTPGGGLLPAGAKVRLGGNGFLQTTEFSIEGVALRSVTYLDARTIELTLATPADLTGRPIRARSANNTAEFFPSLARGKYAAPWFSAGRIQPIFPQQTAISADLGSSNGLGAAIQNPTQAPMEITLQSLRGTTAVNGTLTLGPGETYSFQPGFSSRPYSTTAISQVPFRVVQLPALANGSGPSKIGVSWLPPAKPACDSPYRLVPEIPCWLAVAGGDAVTTQATVQWHRPVHFSVSATTDSGPWLTVRTEATPACVAPPCKPQIALTADPGKLPPGEYNATVTVTPDDPSLLPQAFSFRYRVAQSIISTDAPPYIWFEINESIYSRGPAGVQITATVPGTPFTAKVWDRDGGLKSSDFISVTPTEGVTPATVGIYVNPLRYQLTGIGLIDVFGPSNTTTIPVNMVYRGAEPPPIPPINATMTFWANSGVFSKPQSLYTGGIIDKVEIVTQNATPWLSARSPGFADLTGGPVIEVNAIPAGLQPGVYTGAVNFVYSARDQTAMGRIDVTLVVEQEAEGLTIEPAALTLATPSGTAVQIQIMASSSYGPVTMEALASTETGGDWLTAYDNRNFQIRYTIGTAGVDVDAKNLPPGTYHGEIRVTAPEGSKTVHTVPVTLQVTPALPNRPLPGPPLPVHVVNAASMTPGAVAPGEILTIFGANLGDRVLFDNIPATVLYSASTQVNVVVPDAVAGRTSVAISTEADGLRGAVSTTVTNAAPGLFTADGSGRGPLRLPHPAVRGGRIQLLATGIGFATPASAVTLEIGGVAASVQLAQIAPGLTELTATVPLVVPPGLAVPVVLTVNTVRSPEGVTIALQQ